MYVPQHFSMPDDDVRAMLRSVTAADLVTPSPDGLHATFLPLVFDESAHALCGHVARNNAHWQAVTSGESLVIVRGPDAYVSPGWYAAKQEHGRVVPTWNYVTLHVYGQLVVHDDSEWLRRNVTALTEKFEAAQPTPWAVTDAPASYIDGMLRAIVGLELRITRVDAKAKLSQNRSEADRQGVVEGLRSTAPAVARLMEGQLKGQAG